MKVILMGTPMFAVPMLRAMHTHHTLIGVVTQPDRPKGRKRVAVPPPVKVEAQALGVPVYQFERIKREQPTRLLEQLDADVMVTAAYGQILTKRHLNAAPYGVVNAHASLLPAYRGPAPVNHCLINGEKQTGVTIMHTDVGVDDGDIILSQSVDILEYETAGELLDRLAPLAADLMLKALELLQRGQAPTIPQDHSKASYHPMLTKQDGFLPLQKTAKQICNHARGVTPWPGPCLHLDGDVFRFSGVRMAQGQGQPGDILCADVRDGFVIACGDGAISVREIQAPGKRMMPVADFLRGRSGLCGNRFTA